MRSSRRSGHAVIGTELEVVPRGPDPRSATRRSASSASRARRREGRFGEDDSGCSRRSRPTSGRRSRTPGSTRRRRHRADEMAALADVGREISATLDTTAVLERSPRHAIDLLDATPSAVYLASPTGGRSARSSASARSPSSSRPTRSSRRRRDRRRRGHGGRRDRQRRHADPRTVSDPGPIPRTKERLMVAPLIAHDEVIGVMAVWRTIPDELHPERPRPAHRSVPAGRYRDRQRPAVRRGRGSARAARPPTGPRARSSPR